MLKKLRWKFTLTIMVFVTVTIGISFSAICWLTYNDEVNDVYSKLDRSMDVNWSLYQLDADSVTSSNKDEFPSPYIGRGRNSENFIPIASYIVTETGDVITRTFDSTAVISKDDLSTAFLLIHDANAQKGFLKELGVYYQYEAHGTYLIISFADKSSASQWETLALYLLGLALLLIAVFFLISWNLSKWMLRPAEDAWESQNRFIADASHELKTPLTVIMANNEILKSKKDSPIGDQMQWIESTQCEAENMQDLVNDMLTLARSDARTDQEKTPAENVNMSALTERIALQFESVAFEKNILMDAQVEEDCVVPGWEKDLQRLVSTLIDNACKYSDPGTTVTIRLKSASAAVSLTVTSFGNVIPADDLPHLFDRFYRSDKARTHHEESSSFGLGLAIAKTIVDAHKGTITATSSEQRGTTFVVTLPR
ncbi:MAG: HAMP domain-containing sensor histidine kinase [Eggerthellales bacterium]|nr:HAMP domain-containing sensor histidine kinase [Eggerthellales bacterium]